MPTDRIEVGSVGEWSPFSYLDALQKACCTKDDSSSANDVYDRTLSGAFLLAVEEEIVGPLVIRLRENARVDRESQATDDVIKSGATVGAEKRDDTETHVRQTALPVLKATDDDDEQPNLIFPTWHGAFASTHEDSSRYCVPPPKEEQGKVSAPPAKTPLPESNPGAEAKAELGDALVENPEWVLHSGVKYRGQWKGSLRHGKGTCLAENGEKYDGQWSDDKWHGQGKYTHSDGGSYEGQWQMHKKSGRGIEHWIDGAQYMGEFVNGLKQGMGVYTSGAGARYEGQFVGDEMDGKGHYEFSDGRTYRGQWQKGHMQGMATMVWPNGSKYEGQYQENTKHGEGTFWWPDGRSYRGQWFKGKAHGNGVNVSQTGQEVKGQWEHGQQIEAVPPPAASPAQTGMGMTEHVRQRKPDAALVAAALRDPVPPPGSAPAAPRAEAAPAAPRAEAPAPRRAPASPRPARGPEAQAASPRGLQGGSPRGGAKELQFKVTLVKTPSVSRLGVDVSVEQEMLTILEVQEAGLFVDWNAAHPESSVQPGDQICSVNGKRGSAPALVGLLKSEEVLNLGMLRIQDKPFVYLEPSEDQSSISS